MADDKITEIRIVGMRTIDTLRLRLCDLNVLIGANGSGKSTIVEACELLRQASQADFLEKFHTVHAGFTSLGHDMLKLGVKVEGEGPRLLYEFGLVRQGHQTQILGEMLQVDQGDNTTKIQMVRTETKAEYWDVKSNSLIPIDNFRRDFLVLPQLAVSPPFASVSRAVHALQGIEVHLPFDVMSRWGRKSLNRPSGMRGSVLLRPTKKVELLGNDLANAFYQLKNERKPAHWSETLEYIRLGLGDDVEDVSTAGDAGGGEVALSITFKEKSPIYAMSMSDGMLAYLALIAVLRLNDSRSLLVFDEPDLHLHPHMLKRVVDMLESAAQSQTVLIATQSDNVLDALSNPAHSTLICKLDNDRHTKVYRPEPEDLARWLKRYRGLGDLRSEGYEDFIIGQEES